MNWDEAKKLLKAGKKVRLSTWHNSDWIRYEGGELKWASGGTEEDVGILWEFSDHWEEFVEPPKMMGFVEAVRELKDGRCIKRLGKELSVADRSQHSYFQFRREDIDATDWVAVE